MLLNIGERVRNGEPHFDFYKVFIHAQSNVGHAVGFIIMGLDCKNWKNSNVSNSLMTAFIR
jgi:hypothetical protein